MDLKLELSELQQLHLKQDEINNTIQRKLQMLTVLPVGDLSVAKVNFDLNLLNSLVHDTATLSASAESLKKRNGKPYQSDEALPQVKTSYRRDSKFSRGRTSSLADETTRECPVNLLPQLEALSHGRTRVIPFFEYQDINPDGTPKALKRSDIERFNFSLLLRTFMDVVAVSPCHPQAAHWTIVPFVNSKIASISGPEDSSSSDITYGIYASADAISTYPHCKGRPYREGDPICDRYYVALFRNRPFIVLTDGCNWGEKPRKASRLANKSMVRFLLHHLPKIDSVQYAAQMVLSALVDAHLQIIAQKEEHWMGCTTTAFCGVLLEVDQELMENRFIRIRDIEESQPTPPTKWLFVCANVGDCRALVYCQRTGKVRHITAIPRLDTKDVNDPGGRLGSHRGLYIQQKNKNIRLILDNLDGWPDLRNLTLHWEPVEDNDIVMVMSDGVHDNLDPEIQGLVPADIGLPFTKWEEIPAPALRIIKLFYIEHFIQFHVLKGVKQVTPKVLKDRLLSLCMSVTEKIRSFLSENPKLKVSKDYVTYPGKVDHTTIACMRVGYMEHWDASSEQTVLPPISELVVFPQKSAQFDMEESLVHALRHNSHTRDLFARSHTLSNDWKPRRRSRSQEEEEELTLMKTEESNLKKSNHLLRQVSVPNSLNLSQPPSSSNNAPFLSESRIQRNPPSQRKRRKDGSQKDEKDSPQRASRQPSNNSWLSVSPRPK